jgi:hypothetical protein
MASAKSPDVRGLAQRYTRRALRTLATIMEQGSSEQARIAAADKLLDRAHGKPKAEGESGGRSVEDMVREATEAPDE